MGVVEGFATILVANAFTIGCSGKSAMIRQDWKAVVHISDIHPKNHL